MDYSKDLLIELEGLGIDTSGNPDETKRQITDLYEKTKHDTFGYIEDFEYYDRVFEPVYGIEFFILVKNAYNNFMREYRNSYFTTLKNTLDEIVENSRVARQSKER